MNSHKDSSQKPLDLQQDLFKIQEWRRRGKESQHMAYQMRDITSAECRVLLL